MEPKEKKKLTKALTTYLKDNSKYQDTDDLLIQEVIYNLELMTTAKQDIQVRGQLINLRKSGDEPYYQTNFSITVYHNALKAVQQLYKQLGIEKDKVAIDVSTDAFDHLESLIKGK